MIEIAIYTGLPYKTPFGYIMPGDKGTVVYTWNYKGTVWKKVRWMLDRSYIAAFDQHHLHIPG